MVSDNKLNALATFLGCHTDDLEGTGESNVATDGKAEYLILTDKEAAESISEHIRESLWAFNAEFIINHSKIGQDDTYQYKCAVDGLRMAQEKLCADANGLCFALISNMKEFIRDAIETDGRGHFLNTYDGQENEVRGSDSRLYFIYRVN